MRSLEKYEHLKRSLGATMRAEDVRAVIAFSPENVLHLTGVYIASQRMIRERLATAIFPLDGEPRFVVSSVVAKTARQESWIEEVVVWQEHDTTPVEALIAELRRQGLDHGRIWLEMRYLAEAYFEQLRDALPAVEWLDAELLLDRSRMIKIGHEIELMRRNAIAAERAIWAGFMFAGVGTTEADMARRMRLGLVELGSDGSPFMSLAAGREHTLESHAVPGTKPLEPGDIIAVDMVGTWRGYYSDYARMAVVGPPSPAQQRAWRAVVDVQRQIIEDAQPGVRANELFQHCQRYAEQAGFTLGSNLAGHSLGIALHEYPHLNPYCEELLQPGMTLCIEILAPFPDLGRFHVEDLILVGESGPATRLTTYFDTSHMYEIPV